MHKISALFTCLLTLPMAAQQPIDLGFEAGRVGAMPAGWMVTTQGWRGELATGKAFAGERFLRLLPGADAAPTGVCLRTFDADDYRGRRITLRARLRTDGKGQAQMWLRVDCHGGRQGAFDNMHDRPIRSTDWSEAVIELDVDREADDLALGFLAIGGATVDVDALSLTISGSAAPQQTSSAGPLGKRELQNLIAATRLLGRLWFFHPSPTAVELQHWDRCAVALVAAAGPATDAKDLARRLTDAIAPIANDVQIWAGKTGSPPALPKARTAGRLCYWRHVGAGRVAMGQSIYRSTVEREKVALPLSAKDRAGNAPIVDLGGGVCARVPFRLIVADDAPTAVDAAWLAADAPTLSLTNRDTRLAAVAMAWCVFEHFYPYFDVVDVDWDAALGKTLAAAAEATDETAFAQVLRAMVAELQDGHGYVQAGGQVGSGLLPVRVVWAGEDLVVAGRDPSARDRIALGDIVTAIDGRPVADCYREVSQTISAATEGWRRYRAATALVTDLQLADPVVLEVRGPDGAARNVSLPRAGRLAPEELPPRPDQGSALADGIAYFNLDGADNQAFEQALPKLAEAKAIVFDLRGYPGDAAVRVMEHLITEPGTSARWQVPVIEAPGRDQVRWEETGRWQLRPRQPHLGGKIAFLTDGRAISYAESIMGIVEAYRLGEIVGSTTAGTNGNVNPFRLPGGARVSWTGMRVLKHDGSQHHGVGIAPTVPVVPTAAGIAAGRDEVLAAAIALLQDGIGR